MTVLHMSLMQERPQRLSIDLAGIALELDQATPAAHQRCNHVIERTIAHNWGKSRKTLKEQFAIQSTDPNLYYRGVAYLFWEDFVSNGWGNFNLTDVVPTARLADGSPLSRTHTWTWITGDQHLSNFGAWKNRHGDVVFGINDFDEAAVYDFQMDLWRVGTSIVDHALTNGLSREQAAHAVVSFTDEYIETVSSYMGNERALLHELTRAHVGPRAHQLAAFLDSVQDQEGLHKQLRKFTAVGAHGKRHFIFDDDTKLEPVEPQLRAEIITAMGKRGYGATLQKIGWQTHEWSDEYFEVIDVAWRVNSGDGSYGVSRFYVLLAGSDTLVNQIAIDGVILDVKYTPQPAIRAVLSEEDFPWYDTLFVSEGARVVEAQRRLTSYTDPFAGYAVIRGAVHVVRQRSPWKASLDVGGVPADEFEATVREVAAVTATSHVRGSVGKAPVQFKEVLSSALDTSTARAQWGAAVARTAVAYREQVLMDFACFRRWVQEGAPLEAFAGPQPPQPHVLERAQRQSPQQSPEGIVKE